MWMVIFSPQVYVTKLEEEMFSSESASGENPSIKDIEKRNLSGRLSYFFKETIELRCLSTNPKGGY